MKNNNNNSGNIRDNKNNKKVTEKDMLTGMFHDRRSTESAYNSMHEKGYTEDEINLVMSKETHENISLMT